MDCVLDSGCVFDPVAHVYLFLHLHLLCCQRLNFVLLCSAIHFPASAIYISSLLYSLRGRLMSGILKGRVVVHQKACTSGDIYMLATKKVHVRKITFGKVASMGWR